MFVLEVEDNYAMMRWLWASPVPDALFKNWSRIGSTTGASLTFAFAPGASFAGKLTTFTSGVTLASNWGSFSGYTIAQEVPSIYTNGSVTGTRRR